MTGQFEQVDQIEQQLRRLYADAASPPIEIDRETAAQVISRGRARRRRSRIAIAVGGAVVAVLAAMGGSLVPRLTNQVPQPAIRPPSIPGGEILTPHPFLHHWDGPGTWGGVRRPEAAPPRLSQCVDPRSWGAVITQAATWVDPHTSAHHNPPGTRMNEFLLQYPDASSAHRAFLFAARQFRHCPTVLADPQPEAGIMPAQPPVWDEAFAGQTATPGRNSVYVLLMARTGNVLTVEEDTGLTSDRAPCRLSIAVERAWEHHGSNRPGCRL